MPLSTYEFRKNRSVEIYTVCKGLNKILPDCSTFFASDFDCTHKNCWGGCKLLEGESEYGPIPSKFVDYCGRQSVCLQIMQLDMLIFVKSGEREGGSFQMGVSEIAFTRALLAKIRIPFYVTVYNKICRRFALDIRITLITTLAYLTPGK